MSKQMAALSKHSANKREDTESERLKEEEKMLVVQLVEMDRIADKNKRLKAALDQVKRE